MSRSHWERRSIEVIEKVLKTLPDHPDKRTIVRTVRAAYPFYGRSCWPYKVWLRVQRQRLALEFPELFPKPTQPVAPRRPQHHSEPMGPGLFG